MRKTLLCIKTKPTLKLNSCCFSFQWQFDLAPNYGSRSLPRYSVSSRGGTCLAYSCMNIIDKRKKAVL